MFVLGARDLMLSGLWMCSTNQPSLSAARQSLLQPFNVVSPIPFQARHLHLNVSQTWGTFIFASSRVRRGAIPQNWLWSTHWGEYSCAAVFKLCYKCPACLQRSRRICLTQDHSLIYLASFSSLVSAYFFSCMSLKPSLELCWLATELEHFVLRFQQENAVVSNVRALVSASKPGKNTCQAALFFSACLGAL